jgi:hypothetical protein
MVAKVLGGGPMPRLEEAIEREPRPPRRHRW